MTETKTKKIDQEPGGQVTLWPNLKPELAELGRPPAHFDLAWAWWIKLLIGLLLLGAAASFDARMAAWVERVKPMAQLDEGDTGRELKFLEQFGQWACSIIVILGVWLIDKKGKYRAVAIGLSCLATVGVTYVLKDMIGRPRPTTELLAWMHAGDRAWEFAGLSKHGSAWGAFPSAHTTGAFALACGLSWFYPRGRALFYGLACITGVQRVLHNAHYLSDVVGGAIIAISVSRLTLRLNPTGRWIFRNK